ASGKKVRVVALLVDNVRTAGAKFDARYEQLSTKADLISYNGHAGLGDNVRALAKKGRWAKGQYLITFMNGCDTFAYVDGSLAETRAAINTDDPTGTKYMEIVTNAMPAFFSSMPTGSLALLRGLMKTEAPMTYEQIFAGVDKSQIVVVTGEEDNTYVSGGGTGGGGTTTWAGIKQTATVAKAEEKRFDSGTVQPGTYTFSITGTGDADLYVKVGNAPTTTLYDCRPYKNGSSESCSVNVGTTSVVHVMVRGYAASSKFDLVGKKQ
ncbi:MAG: PPC domain-containing protein, partial [Polyangiales bacterium]